MRDIETAASALGKMRSGDWGAAFGKQLAQLKATPAELEAIRRSWGALHADFDSKNVAAALRKQSISTWKAATVSHLATVRAEAQETEKRILAMNRSIGMGLKPFMVMGGAYTGAYMSGVLGREALISASNERRVEAEAKYAGLSSDERGKIDTRADDLSGRFRLSKSQIYEVMKEASLSMPSTDAALAVSEEMAKAYLVLSNVMGPEGAIAGLRQFNKALDNIERVTPDEYRFGIENYLKAQQVVGKDMDPTAFAEAIKFARAGGKVFGDDFLFKWLPMLIAESGGSDSGTQLRAAFDQFIVGRASKKALGEQKALGLRDDAGRLLNQEKFTENPLTWIWDTMLPKLRERGVDTENETELARVVGQLTNNRLSSDLILRAILSMQQYRRLVEGRLPNALGLDAADKIQIDNPFAAWEGFKSSLENLSAAVLPMSSITSGLNSLADGINAFQKRIREGDPTITYGAAAAAGAGGLWTTYKVTTAITGLISAGTNLNLAATALQRAAVLQAGGDIADVGGTGKKKGLFGFITDPRVMAAVAAALSAQKIVTDFSASNAKDQKGPPPNYYEHPEAAVNAANAHRFHGVAFEGGMHRAGLGAGPMPGIESALTDLDNLRAKAAQTGSDVETSLGVTVRPDIDSSAIDTLISKVRTALSELQRLGSAISDANDNTDRQLRRAMVDYGVSP
ncbi:hypothetical protein [Arvimicrobium flavum]|uniref:hypothetical protein n=1 Tax=Arvimicrobium flavum TaxID=3393320 RepID=UPI00237BE76F|nr:hypothetical protein [Mesorhizobium shangrilense]